MTTENCCSVDTPPAAATGVKLKGSFADIAGFKTYVTGSPDAKSAILDVYDVFGPASQTLQGADILAETLNALVFVPDFLRGNYAKEEWFLTPSAENSELKAEFMKTLSYSQHGPSFPAVVTEAGKTYPSIQSWGIFGLCWGGKMAATASGKGTIFKVSGQGHPSSPTKEDAESMTIPHIALAAPTDNKNGGIDAYKEVFAKEGSDSVVETYETMFHGWMGARAKLDDEENKKEYLRGYAQIAEFFAKYL